MKIYCDLFLDCETNHYSLKMIELLDKSYKYHKDITYSGYLNICVERLKLIPLIHLLNTQKIPVFSVPLCYKNGTIITELEAFNIAKNMLNNDNRDLEPILVSEFNKHTPLFYSFAVKIYGDSPNGFIPNNILIDKIDGHRWGEFDYDKYMYDFNVRF